MGGGGADLGDVVEKLERCTAASLEWARDNAVRCEESKTEAILFSKRRKHKRCRWEIRMGANRVRFNPESTRWLGIWLDASLNLAENRRRRIGNTRQVEARLRRIVNQYGVPPAAARNLQAARNLLAAIVEGTVLYATELTWNGKIKVEDEYQLATNRTSRASLGDFPTKPRGIIMAESGFISAKAFVDHRRARFAQPLIIRPRGGQGPDEILDRNVTLSARLRGAARIEQEERRWGRNGAKQGDFQRILGWRKGSLP